MKFKHFIYVIVSCLIATGCSFQPEKNNVSPESTASTIEIIEVSSSNQAVETVANKDERTLSLKHDVNGKDVLIECYVPNFHFSKEKMGKPNKDGEGHIHLYLNGKKIGRIFKAAFIVKGLPSGKHKLKVEVAHNNHTPYKGLAEEFEVEIP
jgi:hypothetical protein